MVTYGTLVPRSRAVAQRDWGSKGRVDLASETFWLHRLAHHQHILTQYRNAEGRLAKASPDQILALLQVMDIPIHHPEEAQSIFCSLKARKAEAGPAPVTIADADQVASILWSLPKECATVEFVITDEWGQSSAGRFAPDSFPMHAPSPTGTSGIRQFSWKSPRLTIGYHTVQWQFLGRTEETLIIVAPARTPLLDTREWGLFFPLYALSSEGNWGAGNLTDLEHVATWTRQRGGQFIGTLPLLPTFLDEHYDPSPYRPVSQRYWNEFYLDVERLIREEGYAPLTATEIQSALGELRQSRYVDYRHGMALRRRILEPLATRHRSHGFDDWLASHPDVHHYARFRAAMEERRTPWRTWARDPIATEDPGYSDKIRYHAFVQWQMDRTLKMFADRERDQGGGLYLDLPIGVHPDGYDAWRERDLFVPTVSVGAPPDAFFSQGQNWGFSPIHPDRLRSSGYRYFIESLRHHLRYAKILRLDHVMGFYRRFWIPPSSPVHDGLYVRYPAEEFYAIIDLEASRSESLIVGENLGLVPRSIDVALNRHHYLGTWIASSTAPAPDDTLSLVGTHDMPPWAKFWNEASGEQRQRLSDALGVDDLNTPSSQVLAALLIRMAESQSPLAMINVEDLFGETLPINVPGLQNDSNWSRKMGRDWEDIEGDPEIHHILEDFNRHRKKKLGGSG